MPSALLNLGNPQKLIAGIRSLVGDQAAAALEVEFKADIQKLYALSLYHYRFATAQNRRHWRQKISRLYYASYAASRGIRLFVNGHFSTEVADHKKVGSLPDDFPDRARFSNRLEILREDRNTSDYDHSCSSADLVMSAAEAEPLVKEFIEKTREYFEGRGLTMRGKP